jgi:hypothetical protein
MPTDRKTTSTTARLALWAMAVVLVASQGTPGEAALGHALFSGAQPLAAHVAGQDFALPQDAAACASCHESPPSSGPAAAWPDGAPRFGPPLTRAALTQAVRRRGGPPSVYDGVRLCRALRDGIDPAWVVIPQSMPRYAFTDQQCRALWAFLSTRS